MSVGPRGSKITFGHGRVRQTVGLPGTGLYATRQLSSRSTGGRAAPSEPPVAPPSVPASAGRLPAAADGQPPPLEIHYGMPLVVAIVIGIVVAAGGQPATVAAGAAILAFIAGLLYEWLATHHPLAAKVLAQVAVGIVAVVTVVAGIVLVLAAAGVGASATSRRRR